jgi:hypothetical protein
MQIIDGKALAVSGVSKDPDTGYGRGAGGKQKGYKLHAVWGAGPMPIAWALGLYDQRNAIERRFGAWVSLGGGLGPLPAWLRRFSRVRHWVQAKIFISGARWLFLHEPHKLAFA